MAKERLKTGYIVKRPKENPTAWFWVHYTGETYIATKGRNAGKPVQVWERVADVNDKYRSKADVINLINSREIPEHRHDAEDMKIAEFVDQIFLPWAETNKRPATFHGCQKLWKSTRDHVGEMMLSAYRPYHATRYFDSIAPKRTAATLQHVRAFLSKVFAHAVGDGRIDVNPVRDATCRVNTKPTKKAAHYTIAEMKGILSVLQGRERAIVAVSFVGLRPAEIIGLRVEDIKPGAIQVERSMWRGHISHGGKSKNSRRVVPIGPFVEAILADHVKASPSIGGYLFENELGRPLNTAGLERLSPKFIRPTIEKFGYTWKKMYGGRHGAITEVRRKTKGSPPIAIGMFGHSEKVEDKDYLHEIPEETRRVALELDAALSQ